MWWQLIILLRRGGEGRAWQRLSAGGMNIATGPSWNKGRWARTSNVRAVLLSFTAQSPGVGTEKRRDLTCELNAFKQLLPCQKEVAPAASLENVSEVRRDKIRLRSVSVSLLWD